MEPGLVVFDLDGTLIDGYAAIADSLEFAMLRMGFLPLPPGEVRRMVGEGLERLLEKAVGSARAEDGVRLFRERYPEVAVSMTELMPGVRETLEELELAGWRMAVASNKPARFSKMILDANAISGYFVTVGGPDGEVPPKPDPVMLRRILAHAGVTPAEAVVVGDMEIDAQFARAVGCPIVLIPGGSRTAKELAAENPDALLSSIRDLPSWLAGKSTGHLSGSAD